MEKLSALGTSTGVAHDFTNPLAGILGRAQLLQRTTTRKRSTDLIHLKKMPKRREDGKTHPDFARVRG